MTVVVVVCLGSVALAFRLTTHPSPVTHNLVSLVSLGCGVLLTSRDAAIRWKTGRKRLAVVAAFTAVILTVLMLLPIGRLLDG